MNHVYRLVFNRALMVWQVTSELAIGGGGSGARAPQARSAVLSALGFALMCTLGWVSLVPAAVAQAQAGRIVSDPNAPGNERPTVLTAPNGTPLVNITTPSAGGVSRNRYSQFDVGPEGAILNNARGQTQTQLGGWVQGNPWLATGSARVILNEVNGPASRLNGYVEVAGQRAEVIIANPAGIQVNGGGFLNASRVTLTTGTPVFKGGALDGYRVSGGAIEVGGDGLDTSRVDYTDLITRSLQVNAGIWANQLRATLGNQRVSVDAASAVAAASSGQAPAFALDVGALGGMFANKIWLVGNEHGVGVRNAGTIGAQAGELVVTVDGRLENTGALQSRQDLRLDIAQDIKNTGTLSATRELVLNAGGLLDNSGGAINAQRLQVDAASLRNRGGTLEQTGIQALALTVGALSNRDQGTLGALDSVASGDNEAGNGEGGTTAGPGPGGGTSPGTVPGVPSPGTSQVPAAPLAAGALNIAGRLDNDGGSIRSGGAVALAVSDGLDNRGGRVGVSSLDAAGDLDNDAGTLQVHGNAALQVGRLSNRQGRLSVAGLLNLDAQSLDNRAGELQHGGSSAASWNIHGAVDNDKGVLASNAGRLLLMAGSVSNAGGRIEHAGNDGLMLYTRTWSGAAGSLRTSGGLDWSANSIDMRAGSLSADRFQIVAGTLDNRGGTLLSLGRQGSVVRAAGLDNGEGGTIASNSDLTLDSRLLDNGKGLIQQAGSGMLRVNADTLDGVDGRLLSNGALRLSAGELDLSGGTTTAQQIIIDADSLRHVGGQLTSLGSNALQLKVRDELDNRGGGMASNAGLQIDAGRIDNQKGSLLAAGAQGGGIRVRDSFDNSGGVVSANGNLQVQAGQLLNQAGNVLAAEGGRLQVTTLGLLDNTSGGRLAGTGDMILDAGLLHNANGAIEHAGKGSLHISADTVQGAGGRILSLGALQLEGGELILGAASTTQAESISVSGDTLSTAGGSLSATGDGVMDLRLTGALDNRGGSIASNGAIALQAGSVDNQKGSLSAAGTAASVWAVRAGLDNADGVIASNADTLHISAGHLINTAGTISHAGSDGLQLQAGRLDGSAGTIVSKSALSVRATELNHRNATMGADSVDLQVDQLDNRAGRIVASGTAASQIVAEMLDNAGGTVASNGNLVLNAAALDNTGGTVQHAGDGALRIDTRTFLGQRGTVLSNGALSMTGQGIDLRDATTSARAIGIDADTLTTAGGVLTATSDQILRLSVQGTLDNRGGSIGSNGLLQLSAQQFINQQGSVQAAGSGHSTLDIEQALDNQQGRILLGGSGVLDATSVDNRGGTVHAAGTGLKVTVDGRLDNSAQGLLSSTAALDVDAGTLDNQAGTLYAGTILQVGSGSALNNDGGVIQAGDAMQLHAAGLSNQLGRIIGGAVAIDTRGYALSNQGGIIGSQIGALQIRSGALDNHGGRLQSQGQLILDAGANTIINTASGGNGGILAGAGLRIDGGALDNRGGVVLAQGDALLKLTHVDNSGAGSLTSATGLALEAATLNNAAGRVQAGRDLDLKLTGALDNQGGAVAAGQLLTLQASSIDNRNTRTSDATLGLQAGQLQLEAQSLDNRNGQVLTDAGSRVQLGGGLDNRDGLISAGANLDIGADVVSNRAGLMRSDGNQSLTARALTGDGKLHSQHDATLTLQEGMVLNGELVANGTLKLTTSGDLSNQGILRAGNVDLNARNIDNIAGAEITSQGITHLGASGQLTNRGLIDGKVTHLEAGTLDNVGTGRIYGDHVAISAGTVFNRAETVNGASRVATVAARERLDMGVGQLVNTDRGLVYSAGDAAIGGALGADRLATGTAGRIDNLGSVIDVAGNLFIDSAAINNLRENVVVTSQGVKSVDRITNLQVASWQKNGNNTASTLSDTSNYRAYEYYYVSPSDVLQDESYIAPDGTQMGRAVLRLTPITTQYYFAYGGLSTSARGERWRIDPVAGTVTIYYVSKGVQPNPDQVSNVPDPFRPLQPDPSFRYQTDKLTFSSAYGTCSSDCIQFITPAGFDNPETTIAFRTQHPRDAAQNEQRRTAHQTAYDDVLQPGMGADAVIRAGRSMHLSVDDLRNQYGQIVAGGDLSIIGHGIDSRVSNVGVSLYRTHYFNNTSIGYNGGTTKWDAPSISEKIGQVGGQITAGGTLTIDVGDLSNLNQGREAPNVREGAAVANLNVHGPQALGNGPGSGAQGPGQAAGSSAGPVLAQGATAAGSSKGSNVGGVNNSGQHSGSRVVQAAGNSPDRIAMGTPDTTVPTGSLFNVSPNAGNYLVETDPSFTDRKTWLSSDYLLGQMGMSPDALQKRLGDGYYEQKLIREQIGELTGRRFLGNYNSDEAQYQALLEAGATVAKEWGLRPGIALTEAQMAQLTSDIVWLVEQTITLADGSTTTALVPQVYLRLRDGDLDGQGVLLAGANVDITLANGLVNTGNIAGRRLVTVDAGSIEHLGGSISGAQVGLTSAADIRIQGATVTATDALSVHAAGNVTVASTVETLSSGGAHQYQITQTDRVAGLYVTSPTGLGVLSVAAGGDISLQGAQIRNAGTDGITQLSAGGNLELGAQTLSRSNDTTYDNRNHLRSSSTTHVVSSVQGAGDVVLSAGKDLTLVGARVGAGEALVLQAGGDIISQAVVDTRTRDDSSAGKGGSLKITSSDETVRGSQLSAGSDLVMAAGRDIILAATSIASDEGTVLLSAGRDVNLLAVQEQHDYSFDSIDKKKKTLSSTTTTKHASSSDSYAVGTVIEGAGIDISAGRDLTAIGAVIDATGNISLGAGHNVLITAAEDHHTSESSQSSKKSGFTGGFSNGVASVGYAKSSSNSQDATQATTQVGSAIASREGSVLINAGNQLTLAASDVAAGKNLTLVGKDIALLARQDTLDTQSSQASKSSGMSVGITYDPTKAYRSARDSTTDGMADSGSTMGKITRTGEGAASGARAATTSTVITGGSQRSSGNQSQSTSDARVTQLAAGGDMTLIANGGSITSQGAQLSAEGSAVLLATKDIVFDVAHNTASSTSDSRGKGWGFANNTSGLPFGTNNSRSEGSGQSDTITGTQLSVGGGVRMATTEGNISLTAANIAAEKDVTIRAAGDLLIRSGQDTVSNANTADSKAIGTVQISDTEKFSGWHREQHEDDSGMVSQVASNVGSLGGNVNLGAGGKYTQVASNVVAAKDVNIIAAEIELLTADETGHSSQRDKDLKIGVFARVKSPFIDLINNVDAARQSDGRLQAMQGMAAGANVYQAASAIKSAATNGVAGSGTLFSAEAGIGFKTANSSSEGSSAVSRGSTIQGGGNVNLTSTSGDIHIVQGNLSAGNTLSLDSARDILLEAGQAHVLDKSKSRNAGAEVGVGISVGAQTGVYVYAEASVGSSKSNSDASTWQNTELTGKNISLKAEGDTTLRGATATADRIDVKTGGTLTIESLQDIAESMSKDSQVGGRVQVSVGTAWDASGYASAGKADGSYKGVGQQSGLFAGDGGYHVDATHVNLIGGAIASTNAANSELTADTLTFTDLKNEMNYRVSSASISGGFGSSVEGAKDANGKPVAAPGVGGQLKDIGSNIANGNYGSVNNASFSPGIPMTESGHDSSTTYATLTEGNITIGGKKTSAAELGINTDASAAHQAIDALPDLQKILQEQQAMAQATGTVVSTGLRIRADINSSIDEATARKEEAKRLLADPEMVRVMTPGQKAQLVAVALDADREIENLQKVGVLVGAITGGIAASSGSTGQIVASTLAPGISYQIGQYFKENAARNLMDGGSRGEEGSATHLLAHALLGAAVASAGGDSALIGALAAGGAEAAAPSIAKFMFGKESKDLTASEKDTVSSIASIGGAMLGFFQDGLLSAAAGSNAAKNAVDNNWGEVGHYSTMATVLHLAGFSEKDAKAVALAAWAPDTDVRNAISVRNVFNGLSAEGNQQLIHLLDGLRDPGKVVAMQMDLRDGVAVILEAMRKYETNPAAKVALLSDPLVQKILHSFGDSFAHVTDEGKHYPGIVGHLNDGKDPDQPNLHPDAYRAYTLNLYEVAAHAASATTKEGRDMIGTMVDSVTSQDNSIKQRVVLAEAIKSMYGSDKSVVGLVVSPVKDCGERENCEKRPVGSLVNPIISEIYLVKKPAEPSGGAAKGKQ